MMYDRENDNRNNEGRQVQQELEDQLRAFGDTMTDAFAHGFEGRGMDIGDRAWDVGKAAVHAANYGIGEAAKAFRQGRRGYPYGDAKQPFREGAADADTAGMPDWFRQIFAKPEPTPVESIRISAKKRHSAGCTLLAVGITFAVIFGLGTLGCLIGLGTISPAALGDVVVSATEGGGILMTGTDYVMNTAYNVLGIVSSVLGLATAGFGWMTACGAARMKAGRQMGQFADYADSVDYHKGLPVSMLADLTHQKPKKVHKRLQKYIRKGWLNAWLDDETETLYLTAEDYRAAKEAATAAAAQPQPEKAETSSISIPPAALLPCWKKSSSSCRTRRHGKNWPPCTRPLPPSATGWRHTRKASPRPAVLRNIISPPPSSCCTPITTCRGSRAKMPRPSAGISQASCIP